MIIYDYVVTYRVDKEWVAGLFYALANLKY